MKPITIIGGGLSGLSLGIALRNKGIPVTLHEKRSYPFHRVCGEFISGVSEETLETLGITDFFQSTLRVDEVSWHITDRHLFSTNLDSPAYGISRYSLDHQLAQEFTRLGGILHTSSTYPLDALESDSSTPAIIDASGKGSRSGSDWIGLSIHLLDTDIHQLEMHSGPSGYIGISPIEKNKANLTGLFKKDKTLKTNTLVENKGFSLILNYLEKNQLTRLSHRLQQYHIDPASFCAITGFRFGSKETHLDNPSSSPPHPVLRLGDAAQLIPPFVGNGMSMALESAAIAIPHLEAYCAGEISWAETTTSIHKATAGLFNIRMRVAQRFHPLLLSELGLKSIKVGSKLRLLPVKTLYKLTR